MREIKFRAMMRDKNSVHDGLWVYVSCAGNDMWNSMNGRYYGDIRYETVGQYIGLKDKNGKEIYEGDVVRIRSQYETDEPVDSVAIVCFRDGAFRCSFHDMLLGEKVCSGSSGNWNMEVIGNIYENPELAEAQP